MANNTTGFTRIIKAAGYSWKGLRAAWINEAAFRQEGVAVLLAVVIACWLDVDAITRVLLYISSVMLVRIGKSSIAPSKQWLTELALNTMSFPDAQRYGIRRGADCHYRRRDYLVHSVMVAFWITLPDFDKSLVYCAVYGSKIAFCCIYSQHNCIYTQRRNESVNGQATRGV